MTSARRHRDWTVGELLDWTRGRFAAAGIETPRLDAELLLAEAAGMSRVDLYVHRDTLVDEPARHRFRELVQRRLRREPVAYILGRKDFHALSLALAVDARVLVPRPETELLVDWVLEDAPDEADRPRRALDVGTGSGAIALAVARARPGWQVVGIDPSPQALAVARSNAERLDLPVTFAQGRAADLPAVTETYGPFDVLVANLPYLTTDELRDAAPELSFEPSVALDAGPDGLAVFDELCGALTRLPAPPAAVYLEIGATQAEPVTQRLLRAGYRSVDLRRDLAGHPRLLRAREPSSGDGSAGNSPGAAPVA